MYRTLLGAVLAGLGFAALAAPLPELPKTITGDPLRALVVQHDGRCLPLDTLARDLVSTVTGKESPRGADPVLLLLGWALDGSAWQETPLFSVGNASLRAELELSVERTRFGYNELVANPRIHALVEQEDSGAADHKPDPLQAKVRKLHERLVAFQRVSVGEAIRFIPEAEGQDRPWRSNGWLAQADGAEFKALRQAWADLGAAWRLDDAKAFAVAATQVVAEAQRFPGHRPTAAKIATELRYNRLHTFRQAWILLAISALLTALSLPVRRRWLDGLAMTVSLAGFAVFTYGLLLRWTIAGRIPASDMYESLLFLSWGAAAFAVVAFVCFRHRSVPLTAAAIGALALCLADCLPLDPFIRPIAPVLLDTVWMSIHVPVIMISYAVLAIAVLLAHVQIVTTALFPARLPLIARLDRLQHGYILSGSLLLLAGIATGSMWAASSWGRYWGWDPKEVWSLVALLGYMTVLHVRLDRPRRLLWVLGVCAVLVLAIGSVILPAFTPITPGKLAALAATPVALAYFAVARGPFATAAKSIMAFWLIIMTYVGVNYILGTGLHSYGFGAGAAATRMCILGSVDLGLLAVFGVIQWFRQGPPTTTESPPPRPGPAAVASP